MRYAILALVLCACGGGSGGSRGEILAQDTYCGFLFPGTMHVPEFTITYYSGDPDVPVMEDEWGLVREGDEEAVTWLAAWSMHRGDVPAGCLGFHPPKNAIDGILWVDYEAGTTVFVDDVDEFLAGHR